MPDYQLGKIYKIVCNLTGLTYYGSTCEPTLARRLAGHRNSFKLWKNDNTKQYFTSFKCLEGENYEIVLVELFQCDSKMELHKKERFFIENNVCVNKFVPTRTKIEYINENKELIGKKSKKYYIENKELIGEKAKLYRIENKKEFCEYNKNYYFENKETIKKKNKETYECECGSIITKCNHLSHERTKKHIRFINNKPVI